MGGVQSTDKKSPINSKKNSPEKEDSPSKSPSKHDGVPGVIVTTPSKDSSAAGGDAKSNPSMEFEVSEAEVASVEAVTKTLRDTTGGKSMEIVLSPAVKKPKSRVSPPTSPTSNQETIAKKFQEAEERKQLLDQEKLQKLAAKLEKIPNAQEKKEKIITEKSVQIKEKLESKLIHAEESKKKQLDDVKEKFSEHTAKIEKAQQALEAAIEAAKEATKVGLDEKMSKNEEKKNLQLEEMMNALKEHSEHIKNVRNNMDEKIKPKAQQILENMVKKEEAYRELKAKQEAERKLKAEEQKKKAELVRMNKEKLASEQSEPSLTTESA